MRTLRVMLHLLIMTPFCGGVVILASVLGIPERPGSIYGRMTQLWARSLMRWAGVPVRVHNPERLATSGTPDDARIYMSNHVSWFDVFALAAQLPRFRFIAKAELAKLPIFGPAAGKAAAIYIERDNRKAAFDTYKSAVEIVRRGVPVCVFPEGTRGRSYAIRPFKKGPFVFAIAAAVPIVPVIIHGTFDIQPKGAWRIRRGEVDIHLLEPISTTGLSYDDRDSLMRMVHERMESAMRDLYGVQPQFRKTAPVVTSND